MPAVGIGVDAICLGGGELAKECPEGCLKDDGVRCSAVHTTGLLEQVAIDCGADPDL